MIQETIEAIEARLTAKLLATPPYNSINMSPSAVALWSNFLNTLATEFFTQEQLSNTFQTEIEAVVADAVPGTAPWIQNEVKKFQYSASTAQVVALNADFSVGYPTIDDTLKIISNAAIVVVGSGVINIKVATGTTPAPLSSPQKTALTAYLNSILPAGANFNIINYYADLLQVNATVYYNGQYNAVIQTNVNAALAIYMASLPFNGVVKLSDIEKAILAVAGVVDVTFQQVTCTPGTSIINVYGTPVNLVLGSLVLSRSYQTSAGYIVNDTTPNDFSTTILYTVANN